MKLTELVIGSIDGERDPRCIMSVFQIVQSIMELIQSMSAQSAEDLFDVVACYFPITDTGHSS